MSNAKPEPKAPLLQPLHPDSDDAATPNPRRMRQIFVNFMVMSTCFSLNHGTVTALIAIAAPELGDLGIYATGTLYIMYTLVALLFSSLIVSFTGPKWGIVAGLGVYCVYVVSFLIAHYAKDIKNEASLIGSGIGGIAAGFLWTAQGGYFATSCKAYASAACIPREKATSWFGGVFACLYLAGEVCLKLLSSLLKEYGSNELVFITFSAVAFGSTVAMACVQDLSVLAPDEDDVPKTRPSILARVLPAIKLLTTDAKMILLLPAQIAFGVMAVYLNSYANVHVVKDHLGDSNVGYLAAVVAATAAALTIPVGWLTTHISKVHLMVLGGLLFALESIVFMVFSDSYMGTWARAVPIYALHGAARCIWESTNKAVMADFFKENAPAAFACVIMASGGASAICFFAFPHMSKQAQLSVCLFFSLLQVVCSVPAFVLHRQRSKVMSESITI